MGAVAVGVDLGQKNDPSSICVVEGDWRQNRKTYAYDEHYLVRHLERMQAGTSYPEIVERLSEILKGVKKHAQNRPNIYIDATGLGDPIINLFREAVFPAIAVYFNHGDRRKKEKWDRIVLGKAWAVARLQALLQCGRLHLPDTEDAKILAEDLLDYEIKVSEDANDQYGAFRVGSRDDLVTALGLAVQEEPLSPNVLKRLDFV